MAGSEIVEEKKDPCEDRVLERIYYDSKIPAAYSSVSELLKEARKVNKRIEKNTVERWLSKQKAYVFHGDRRLKFKRSVYNVGNIDDLWQTDLIDLQKFAKYNRGYKYIVAVIDCFSKYAWCIPIKKKTFEEIIRAFDTISKLTTHQANQHAIG